MHARIEVMFDFIFGWRKASKCKKLMKKVRCRLHLLKNKRSCIARQLRNDVAQLIKHGHYQTAFDRVDQIYKDECIIAVYDLLAHFCEFLSHQLSYIRRSKDCPNDINEAISSLIFASARCGELPELLRIRKLFHKRYGERFEARALGLLPGNLVNFQIRENLSINKVPNEVKYKLVEEITTSFLQTGPLALEFTSEQASEIIYQDEIEEFQSPLKECENGKDQRVFMFTSSSARAGNPKSLDLLTSLIGKLGDWRRVSSNIHENAIGEVGICSKKCGDEDDGVLRSYNSFRVQTSSADHVHPKLPDYDELAARFKALKKEKFQNQEIDM